MREQIRDLLLSEEYIKKLSLAEAKAYLEKYELIRKTAEYIFQNFKIKALNCGSTEDLTPALIMQMVSSGDKERYKKKNIEYDTFDLESISNEERGALFYFQFHNSLTQLNTKAELVKQRISSLETEARSAAEHDIIQKINSLITITDEEIDALNKNEAMAWLAQINSFKSSLKSSGKRSNTLTFFNVDSKDETDVEQKQDFTNQSEYINTHQRLRDVVYLLELRINSCDTPLSPY